MPSGPVTHKFGGTSVASAERYRRVADILLGRDEAEQLVVVSAMKGVTDALIALAQKAGKAGPAWTDDWEALRLRHVTCAQELLGEQAAPTVAWLTDQFADLHSLLHALSLLGGPSEDGARFVQGLGEVFSARLLTAHFEALGEPARMLDAREVLVVRHGELGVTVDWVQSQARFDQWQAKAPGPRTVVTGFIARDAEGRVTTLGRNGSDFSGAIFGALAKSPVIEIWTDVDGVLSADPRLVPEAVLLPTLSYSEACELAYFGAKVIHPQTMAPAIERRIPIRIRNTFNPSHPGSVVSEVSAADPPVKGLTTFGNLAVLNVEGAGMIGVPGTAERVFGALHRAGVSVVMISQGSSEHSICCVVEAARAPQAVEALQDAFAGELDRGQLHRISSEPDITVLAIVGDGMAGTPGVAARLFESMARAQVNVRAIAQGSSERNISVAVQSRDAGKALRAVHAGFYLSPHTLSLGLVGPGRVGRMLVNQLSTAQERLKREAHLDVRVRAITTLQRMALDEVGIDLAQWEARLAGGTPADLDHLTRHVLAPHLPHAVIIDCSASDEVAERYAQWLKAGIHVITPNKSAGSGRWERYQAIRAASQNGPRFRYEATVGAGLPIITTLRDLLDTGDDVLAVEGILSGTLAWLFNRFDGTTKFSDLVRDARRKGYTEPDPRDDLSGLDVARKLVILAREMGGRLSVEDVEVESLVPPSLRDGPADQFLERAGELDDAMRERLEKARAQGHVLRYVAKLDAKGKARVGLVECPLDHAFAHVRLTDNVVQFTTRRYRDNPLVVQGPGAGPDVTAAGVFADLLRVAASLGARL